MNARQKRKRIFLIAACFMLLAAFGANWILQKNDPLMDRQAQELVSEARKLASLAKPIGPVQGGDWLESHPEPGQTFRQYLEVDPVALTAERGVLYVQPIGEFNDEQRKIVELSAEFLGLYFACPVTTLDGLSTENSIPEWACRVHPSWGVRQIKTTFILDQLLKPNLPDDAFALIAFTTSDLYPEDDWNFVFGQASLRHRVGVWSLFRNGDPVADFKNCLLRTLKTASHETGHMFSIRHCTAFDCNMCGSNNLEESDRRPLELCPECVAKLWFATECDHVERFKKLVAFCDRNGLTEESKYYRQAVQLLETPDEK